jgi:hypothetical protein
VMLEAVTKVIDNNRRRMVLFLRKGAASHFCRFPTSPCVHFARSVGTVHIMRGDAPLFAAMSRKVGI